MSNDTSQTNDTAVVDPFGSFSTDQDPVRIVEVEVPSGWKVRVVEGASFQVRLMAIDTESEDEGDSNNISENQPRGSGG